MNGCASIVAGMEIVSFPYPSVYCRQICSMIEEHDSRDGSRGGAEWYVNELLVPYCQVGTDVVPVDTRLGSAGQD